MVNINGDLTDLLKKHVILIFDGLTSQCEKILETIENRNKNSNYLKELKDRIDPKVEYTLAKDFYSATT